MPIAYLWIQVYVVCFFIRCLITSAVNPIILRLISTTLPIWHTFIRTVYLYTDAKKRPFVPIWHDMFS